VKPNGIDVGVAFGFEMQSTHQQYDCADCARMRTTRSLLDSVAKIRIAERDAKVRGSIETGDDPTMSA
jgi:hypothetical protein